MSIILSQIIRNTRQPRMHIATTQIFGGHDLPSGGFDQRRAGQENRPLLFYNDRDVRHRGHIGPTRRTRPHHNGNLGNTLGAHPGLIVENPAKVIAVRKHLVLIGQVRPAAVDKVDAGQMVFLRDLLRTEVFLDGHRIVRTTLHGGIVADDHAKSPADLPDPRNRPGTGRGPIIHPMRGHRTDLQKRRPRIQEVRHPIPRQHLAPRHMPLPRPLPATSSRQFRRFANNAQSLFMRGAVVLKILRVRQNL